MILERNTPHMSERPTPSFLSDTERLNAGIDTTRERKRKIFAEFFSAQKKLDELMVDNGPARASEQKLRMLQEQMASPRTGARALLGVVGEVVTALQGFGRLASELAREVRGTVKDETPPTPEQALALWERLKLAESAAQRYTDLVHNRLASGAQQFSDGLRDPSLRRDVDRLVHEAKEIARISGLVQHQMSQVRIQWGKAMLAQKEAAAKP